MVSQKNGGVMAEDTAGQQPVGGDDYQQSDQEETTSIPMALLHGQQVKEGDVIRLKVVAVDAENNAVTVTTAGDEEHSPAGGSDELAKQFDKPKDNQPPKMGMGA